MENTAEVQAIVKRFEFHDGTFPRKALQEAMAKQDRIIPELLNILTGAR